MTADPVELANPWRYLEAEGRHRDGQAEEALFLSYNVDTAFFESRILGICQAAGARVTLVADAQVWDPNPRALTLAGRAYHVGLTVAPGAFHPKLVVLVGAKRVVVAIGSGNLTLGGWRYNSELWSVWTGSEEGVPAVIPQLADFLFDLAAHVLERVSSDAIRRCAAALRRLAVRGSVTDLGQHVVSNLAVPIIDQLPRGPVDELNVYAPFLDPACAALEALVDRFAPGLVTVAVQPGRTVLESAALSRFVADCAVPVEVLLDGEQPESDPRYRHGKLIEWATDGDRYALTGSANLSRAALLATPREGNVELGVISRISQSLLPPGRAGSAKEVPTTRITAATEADAGPSDAPSLLVLAAVLVPDGLRLTLPAAASRELLVQVSRPKANRDDWAELGVLPVGDPEPQLPVQVAAGSRVRLAMRGTDGQIRTGPVIAVTDPALVSRRSSAHTDTRTRHASAPDLFGVDLSVLDGLWADLEQLAEDVSATTAPRMLTSDATDQRADGVWSDTDVDPWFWELNSAIEHHGSGLAAFGLGLPPIPGASEISFELVEALTDEKNAALEDDTAETADSDDADLPAISLDHTDMAALDHRTNSKTIRQARQKWCIKAVKCMPRLPLSSRMTALRVLLVYWSAGNWAEGDLAPIRLAADAVRSLDHGPRSDELARRVGSLVALTLTMIRDRVDLTSTNEGALVYRTVAQECAYLSLERSEEATEEFCSHVSKPAFTPIRSGHVDESISRLLDDDPLSDPIAVLESEHYDVARWGTRALIVHGTFRNAETVALRALALVETCEPIGVWAVNPDGGWAFLAWRRPDLIRVTPLRQGCRWRHQVLNPLIGPAALYQELGTVEGLRGERRHIPQNRPFQEALELLDAVGVPNPPLPPQEAAEKRTT